MGLGGRDGGANGCEIFLPVGVEGWEVLAPVGVEAEIFLATGGWDVFRPGLKKNTKLIKRLTPVKVAFI